MQLNRQLCCRDPVRQIQPRDVWLKHLVDLFELYEPSHNTHTPQHSEPIDADREGRLVTERVEERQKDRQG